MADKKYTEQEITEMADRCYIRCVGVTCSRYEPVQYGYGESVQTVQKLFECANPGCYYSSKLPWGDAHWCWLFGARKGDEAEAEKLCSLTWNDLVSNVTEKSR